jgi:hypothetical protein
MRGIPKSDRRRTTVSLIPGPIDEGWFWDDTIPLSPMPADQDILTGSERLGGAACTPASPAKADGILLHKR